MTRAIIAARKGDRPAAQQFIREAWAVADRLGQDRNDFWTIFGPTNVAIHAVSVDVELGDPAAGLRKAPSVNLSRLSPELVERRVYHMIDVARGYASNETMRRRSSPCWRPSGWPPKRSGIT